MRHERGAGESGHPIRIPVLSLLRVENADDLPAEGGAYALVIDLSSRIIIRRTGKPDIVLAGGRYVYAGSAYGPGGIRSRVGRHLKTGKTVRWHIDNLTNAADVTAVVALTGGNECAIVSYLLDRCDARVPAPGFGSSDCPRCGAHLLGIGREIDLEDMARTVGVSAAFTWRRPRPALGRSG